MTEEKKEVREIYVTRSSMPPYEEYIEAIKPLWDSHRLTNMGVYHKELEHKLAEYLDVPLLSLMVNGHMALELLLQSFEFPEGSEVITTPFTFVSTTHAILRNRLKPVFCDIRREDGTIDDRRIEELITPKTVAILPVHVYGNVCQVEQIQEIALKYGLKVIYDAAHAFGVKYKEKGIGNYGDASIFSFHSTKAYNTIEGGAVVCKNKELYEKLYNLKNFGIRNEELVVSVGANAKMNEFSAIMGLCNLNHISKAIESRKKAFDSYKSHLGYVRGIRIFEQRANASRNYAYVPVIFTKEYPYSRDQVYDRLASQGIHARKYFYPLTSDEECFADTYCDADLDTARDLAGSVLCLPVFEGITEEEICRITDIILKDAVD